MAVEVTRSGTRGKGLPTLPRWLMPVFKFVNVAMFRLGGRRLRIQGRPLVLLTTVGAQTGVRRQTTLGVFPDGERADSWLVVASNAGSAKHPAWYYNLAKHPDQVWIELGTEPGRAIQVQPESLQGEAREAAWREVTRLAPGYAAYESQTDRQIPIVRLNAIERAEALPVKGRRA